MIFTEAEALTTAPLKTPMSKSFIARIGDLFAKTGNGKPRIGLGIPTYPPPRCPCVAFWPLDPPRISDGRTGIVPYAPVPRLTTRLKLDGLHVGAAHYEM